MDDDSRRAKVRDDAIGQVAFSLGGAAREQHHVMGERLLQECGQALAVIGDDAEHDRFAAQFADGVGQDGRVAVIDETGPHRRAGGDQLIAGREDRDPRLANGQDRCHAQGR